MRIFLIKILFRLLDKKETYSGINDDAIEKWLTEINFHPGFKEYIRKRDLQLLKTLAVGLDKETSRVWIGQRFELLRLAHKAREEAKKVDKKNPKIKKHVK